MSNDTTKEQYEIAPLQATITTYQLIGDKWEATISHTFHGKSQQEIFDLIESHKSTDTFFAASFTGTFYYYSGVIYLKNSEMKIQYP
jgi:uncharacterized protein YpbB